SCMSLNNTSENLPKSPPQMFLAASQAQKTRNCRSRRKESPTGKEVRHEIIELSSASAVRKRHGIPTGFRPKAQGCEERATLGRRLRNRNPERVAATAADLSKW